MRIWAVQLGGRPPAEVARPLCLHRGFGVPGDGEGSKSSLGEDDEAGPPIGRVEDAELSGPVVADLAGHLQRPTWDRLPARPQ